MWSQALFCPVLLHMWLLGQILDTVGRIGIYSRGEPCGLETVSRVLVSVSGGELLSVTMCGLHPSVQCWYLWFFLPELYCLCILLFSSGTLVLSGKYHYMTQNGMRHEVQIQIEQISLCLAARTIWICSCYCTLWVFLRNMKEMIATEFNLIKEPPFISCLVANIMGSTKKKNFQISCHLW